MCETPRASKRFRRREVVFTPADERAFSSILRKTFADMRFLGDYQAVVRDFFAEDSDRKGIPNLPYVKDLSKVQAGWRIGWLEPKDWIPEFSPHPYTGVMTLSNPPHLAFQYPIAQRRIFPSDHSMVTTYRVKEKPLPKTKSREPTTLHVAYLPNDEETKKFASTIMRLVTKVAVNTLIRVDPITGYSWIPPARERDIWVGLNALDWCRKNPRNFIDGNLRPGDEAEERHRFPMNDPEFYSFEEASERMHSRFSQYMAELKARRKDAKIEGSRKKYQTPTKKKGG